MFPGFDLFGKFISSYTLMALLGIFAAGIFAMFQYNKKTGDYYPMLVTLLFSAVGVGAGGCILYGITNIKYWPIFLKISNFDEFIQAVSYIFGGSVFYGGLIGGMIVAAIIIKRNKYPSEEITDCAAPAIAMFHCFGRVGCFLGGCCYGVESDFGFIYHNSLIESANGVRRFPVQLVEAGFELILFFLLWYLLKKGKGKGILFGIYLLIYPIGRFILEFFRGDGYRGFIFGLSTSQFISIFVFVFAIGFILLKKVIKPKNRSIPPEITE